MRAATTTSALFALFVLGCPGVGDDDDDDTAIQDDDSDAVDCIQAMEATVQEVNISTGVTIDWSGFTEDQDGSPVDPEELSSLSLVGLALSSSDAIHLACDNALEQGDVGLYMLNNDSIVGTTSAEIEWTGLDDAPPQVTTLMATVSSGSSPGEGAYATAIATVDEDSSNTVIYVEAGGVVPPLE